MIHAVSLPVWVVWTVLTVLTLAVLALLVRSVVLRLRVTTAVAAANETICIMRNRYLAPVRDMMESLCLANHKNYVDSKGRRIRFGDTMWAEDAIGNRMRVVSDFKYVDDIDCPRFDVDEPMVFIATDESVMTYEEMMSRFSKVRLDVKTNKEHDVLDEMTDTVDNPCPIPAWVLNPLYGVFASVVILLGYRRKAYCDTLAVVARSRADGIAGAACRFFENRVCNGERVTDDNFDALLDECRHREFLRDVADNDEEDSDTDE